MPPHVRKPFSTGGGGRGGVCILPPAVLASGCPDGTSGLDGSGLTELVCSGTWKWQIGAAMGVAQLACWVPHLDQLEGPVWQPGGRGRGSQIPRRAWPALPRTKEGTGAGTSPAEQQEMSCPVDLTPAPSSSLPWLRCGPGPLPSLISPLCLPSAHSSHVISQTYQAFPTSGPWPVLFPLPGTPAPPLFPWHPPVDRAGLSWIVTSLERLS